MMLNRAYLPAMPEPRYESTTATTAVAWRSDGRLNLTVIAKATFAFAPDGPMPRIDPQEILRADVHHGNNPARSVLFTSDLAPYLAHADVLFTGSAYAPEGCPVQTLPVRLAIFDSGRLLLDKRLVARAPRGFERMPMVYERSTRGIDGQDNPFGLDPSEEDEPRILDPDDPNRPAGFGPIGRSWPVRKRLLGSVPRQTIEGPIAEIPKGFNWSYFQAAPLDQRIEWLRGNEWIALEGLHPSLPRFRTRLPGVRGTARIFGLSALGVPEGKRIDLHLDTLRIDGDDQRCTVVCRRSIPIGSEAALSAVRIVAAVEVAQEEESKSLPPITTLTLSSDAAARARHLPILPFVPQAFPSGIPAPDSKGAAPCEPAPSTGTLALVPEENEAAASRHVMPFRAAAPQPIAGYVPPIPPERPAPAEAPIEPGEPAMAPEPPPMIGPLAKTEVAGRAVVMPESPPPSHVKWKDVSLEKCAAIAAAIACRGTEISRILDDHGLQPADFTALERSWMEAIRAETSKGKTGLLRRFDAAYVDQIEKERGPITASEYARLALAAERGATADALTALSLPPGAAMRIERVWAARMAQDKTLRQEVRDARRVLHKGGSDSS